METLLVDDIEGKCEVKKKIDLPSRESPTMSEHVFYCERLYEPSKGSVKQVTYHFLLKRC